MQIIASSLFPKVNFSQMRASRISVFSILSWSAFLFLVSSRFVGSGGGCVEQREGEGGRKGKSERGNSKSKGHNGAVEKEGK